MANEHLLRVMAKIEDKLVLLRNGFVADRYELQSIVIYHYFRNFCLIY